MFKKEIKMDLTNLFSSLASFSEQAQKTQEPSANFLYPTDYISVQQFEGQNKPTPQNIFQDQNMLTSLLPLLLLLFKGKTNIRQVFSKISAFSPALKKVEPFLSLLSLDENQEKEPSISSYKRIE